MDFFKYVLSTRFSWNKKIRISCFFAKNYLFFITCFSKKISCFSPFPVFRKFRKQYFRIQNSKIRMQLWKYSNFGYFHEIWSCQLSGNSYNTQNNLYKTCTKISSFFRNYLFFKVYLRKKIYLLYFYFQICALNISNSQHIWK